MTELREGLARALCALKVSQTSEEWLRYRQDDSWQLFTQEADASIACLWPLAMAHAAGVADEYAAWHNKMDDGLSGFDKMALGAEEVAAAIRSQEPPK